MTLKWLPSFGRGEVVAFGPLDHRADQRSTAGSHLMLPAITLAVFQLTLIMRLVRSEMLEVLRADYIKFARARGLAEPGGLLSPRAEEHAGAGDHDHRPADRRR